MTILAATTSTSSGLPVNSSTISLISIILSGVALLVALLKYKEQKRQGREIERQSQELERHGNEIERQSGELERHGDELATQSTAMESEFKTDIHVENAKPAVNKLELRVSNLGYGRGKNLELKTEILVDGCGTYAQPHRKPLERIDSEEQRSSCVIEDGEQMAKFQAEPLVRVDLPNSEPQNMSFPSGIEQMKEHATEQIEIDMKLCDTDSLGNESENEVFDTPQIIDIEEITRHPSLESMINRGEY